MPHEPTAFELIWKNYWVRAISYILLIFVVVWLLITYRGGYLFALQVGIVGFVIAYILNPLVNVMQRIRIRRSFAVVLVYILLINLIVFGSVMITLVIAQLGRFIELIPTAFNSISTLVAGITGNVSGWLTNVSENLPTFLSDRFGVDTTNSEELSIAIQSRLQAALITAVDSITTFLEQFARQGPGFLISSATSIISTTLQIVLMILASAYFLYDFPKFVQTFRNLFPVRYRYLFDDLSQKADTAVGGYLRGQLLITLCLGVFIYIGLAILNIPSALAISFLAAIFNLVPYLGPIIGVIPAVLLGFTVSPWVALGAVIVFIVANQLEGNVLGPYILSKSTNLHPVTVLLAILVGAGLFGLLGALLAVPITALGKVVLEEYLFKRPAYQESLFPHVALSSKEVNSEPSKRAEIERQSKDKSS